MKDLRLLLIEDNDGHAELFRRMLEEVPTGAKTPLDRVSCLTDGINKCTEHKYNVVFLDLGLPESLGLETLSSFMEQASDLPVIVLTAQDDLDIGVESIKRGAQDYIVKGDMTPALLEKVIRYAIERKRSIIQLEHRNTEIQKVLHEREVLLKEIHHRVKNNMQIISSLLSLQANISDDPTVKEAFGESQLRVRSMALVHERLYRSNSLALVSFKDYVREISLDLQRIFDSARKVTLVLDLAPIELPIDKAVPCGLLLNELLTNAFKYAFEPNKPAKLKIRLSEIENDYELAIADNGKGLPESIDPFNAKTLGLQLVQILSRQLGAKLQFSRDKGTLFSLRFPRVADYSAGSQIAQ